MKLQKHSTFIAALIAVTVTILGISSAQAEGFFYRFAPPLGAVTCTTSSFGPQANISIYHVEYNLPQGATIVPYLFFNDEPPIIHTSFAGPVGMGSLGFSAFFRSGGEPFPFRIGERFDTLINGKVVYRSSLILDCPGLGDGTVTVADEAFGGGSSAINDGRINPENYAPVALYCDGSVLTAYAIDGTGVGTPAWTYNFAALSDALPNQLGIALLHSPDVRFSILAAQPDGKQYLFVFNGCPAPGTTETYLSDPATGQFVRAE